jgi:hypothetical protein
VLIVSCACKHQEEMGNGLMEATGFILYCCFRRCLEDKWSPIKCCDENNLESLSFKCLYEGLCKYNFVKFISLVSV